MMRFSALLVFLLCVSASAETCTETVVIDSIEYQIPVQWCGQQIDTAELAKPEDLVKLPAELCYEGRRIYVTSATRKALMLMAEAARSDSVHLMVASGYRSAPYQARIIQRRIDNGQSFDNIMYSVAPPGYSQHETGRAVDFRANGVFGHTETYRWLAAHAAEYGFTETYPNVVGSSHPWEAWHWYFTPIPPDSTTDSEPPPSNDR